jgi:hypothetical protein
MRVNSMSTELQSARWSRPLVGIATVAVVGAGLGAFFGIRAVQGAGSGPTSGQPPARTGAAMAYDAANRTVVLFGGQSKSRTLSDTWTWDGAAWTQAHPAASPPAMDNAQMAYDPVSHDVVLVGGQEMAVSNGAGVACSGGSGTASAGSSGSSTTLVPPGYPVPAGGTVPNATSSAKRSTPPAEPACGVSLSPRVATWLWDGSSWSKASGTTPSTLFGSGTLATDPVSGRVLLLPRGPFAEPALGAAQAAIACPVQSPAVPQAQPLCPWPITIAPAWTWTGHQWKLIEANVTTSPYQLFSSSLVTDAVSGKLATFGGNFALPAPMPYPCTTCQGSQASQPSTVGTGTESVWNGTTWKQVVTYHTGPALPGVAFVGDPAAHSDVVLASDGQTWLWTGTWTRVHPGATPPIVSGAASAYDAATSQVIIFGGVGTTGRQTGFYDQTWTWNGSDWTQRGGSAGPSVTIPVPSPISVPPAAPCQKLPPTVPPASGSLMPALHCAGSAGTSGTGVISGSSGSSGAVSGAAPASGVVAP